MNTKDIGTMNRIIKRHGMHEIGAHMMSDRSRVMMLVLSDENSDGTQLYNLATSSAQIINKGIGGKSVPDPAGYIENINKMDHVGLYSAKYMLDMLTLLVAMAGDKSPTVDVGTLLPQGIGTATPIIFTMGGLSVLVAPRVEG